MSDTQSLPSASVDTDDNIAGLSQLETWEDKLNKLHNKIETQDEMSLKDMTEMNYTAQQVNAIAGWIGSMAKFRRDIIKELLRYIAQ